MNKYNLNEAVYATQIMHKVVIKFGSLIEQQEEKLDVEDLLDFVDAVFTELLPLDWVEREWVVGFLLNRIVGVYGEEMLKAMHAELRRETNALNRPVIGEFNYYKSMSVRNIIETGEFAHLVA